MRRIFVIILGLFSLSLYSQKENSILNHSFSELIYDQLLDNLEGNISAFIYTPTLVAFVNYTYIKSSMFYSLKPEQRKDIFSKTNYTNKQLFLELDNPFIGQLKDGNRLLLKARYKNNILYEVELSKNEDIEKMIVSSANKKHNKTIVYESGQFKKMTVDRFLNTATWSNIVSPDVNIETYHSTSNGMYTVKEDKYKNGLLQESIIYKPTIKLADKKIENYTRSMYDSRENLIAKVRYSNKDKIIDSLYYYYQDGYLTGARKFDRGEEHVLLMENVDGQIQKLRLAHGEGQINIEYFHDDSNRISRMIVSRNAYDNKDFRFLYNKNKQLISIENYRDLIFEDKVNFEYYDNGIIKSMSKLDKSGRITKEITYSIDYL
jgi:hypothetical protein